MTRVAALLVHTHKHTRTQLACGLGMGRDMEKLLARALAFLVLAHSLARNTRNFVRVLPPFPHPPPSVMRAFLSAYALN